MASMDQALSLLAAAKNHGDLAVKLSSLKQARDILFSVEPSLAAELCPYLFDLQYSPEGLVRQMLLEIIEGIGLKVMENCSILMPVVLSFLKDRDPSIARQSIVTGTHLFCGVLEELALQFRHRGKVERWLEDLWIWMLKFKESVFAIALEPGSVGTKLLALKFLETYILLFTPETHDSDKHVTEGSKQSFNVSWITVGHPVLDPVALISDASRTVAILLDFLSSARTLPASLTIAVVNGLAAVARKRTQHYVTVLGTLIDFDPNFESASGCHTASIHYSVRTAFLGFLRSTHPSILESRERLLRILRAMNAGDAADQVVRQVDKIIKNNERASRESRFSREDQASNQLPISGDYSRKRYVPVDGEEPANGYEMASKRIHYGSNSPSSTLIQVNDSEKDSISANGVSAVGPLLDRDLTPAEQMIAMIGALLAEGERGAESLELLISNIHPDMLADIVITNMKHLPKSPPPLTRNLPVMHQSASLSSPAQVVTLSAPMNAISSVLPQASGANTGSLSLTDASNINNFPADSKRDPRRDPRRLDPRRAATSVGVPSVPVVNDVDSVLPEFDGSLPLSKPPSGSAVASLETTLNLLMSDGKNDDKNSENALVSETDQDGMKEHLSRPEELVPNSENKASSDHAGSSTQMVDEDPIASKGSDVEVASEVDTPYILDSDDHPSTVSNNAVLEETCQDLPELPPYIEFAEEQLRSIRNLAVERIIHSYKLVNRNDIDHTRLELLARLVAQIDADEDIMAMLQKHIVVDYRQQKGHELVLYILYHLHSLMILEDSSYAADMYETFLLVVVKSLLDTFPASDKSFSRLLGEVPYLTESALKLLDDLCYHDVFDSHGKEVRDAERVTQGLGAVWGLILGRPNNRHACLDIALKCAVHSQDDIRGKAIRLVANKLYQLSYISEKIEQFATSMLLSAVNHRTSDLELSQSVSADQREGEVGSQETSVSGSQVSETGNGEHDSAKGVQAALQNFSTLPFPEAQRLISLFFALCTKKPSLFRLVFDVYGRAPKTVKQAVHRHVPILIRALGSSYSELLPVVSDPPEGCENLLILVLQILTQETTPSADLIATVKHLYENKLKDASILIPILSSLSKSEVLPIFPRLVGLPIEKFQMALAHILQGSAHTGPALTPAEVLVAIHDISPEKDGLALKKITDACTACFEQRTVFTQQVLARALNQMVDLTPLPLLFMRTVIQAIDAFPTLVDFVMEILSKLVSRQVWKMPKLWVGFMKCVSQTRPHSFHVLLQVHAKVFFVCNFPLPLLVSPQPFYDYCLQLPPPQLESALNKHANLRGPLAAFASQPSMKASLPRSTLAVLGLVNESHVPQLHVSALQTSNTSSSAHEANFT